MESFSLLKYWRGGGGGGRGGGGGLATSVSLPTMLPHGHATLGATVLGCAGESAPGDYGGVEDADDVGGCGDGGCVDDDDDCSSTSTSEGCDDEGPFFDLEFAVPDDEDDDSSSSGVVGVMDGSEADGGEVVQAGAEFGFAVEAASSSTTPSDGSVGLTSPSRDDLFFKGRLVPLETAPGSGTTMTTSLVLAEPNSRHHHQFMPVSTLLKSATRFRVFAMGLKKGTGGGGGGGGGAVCGSTTTSINNNSTSTSGVAKPSGGVEPSSANVAAPSPKHPPHGSSSSTTSSKFFTVKYLKVVEEVPIMSLFSRDSSSRSNSKTTTTSASARQSSSSDLESTIANSCVGAGLAAVSGPTAAAAGSDEKKSSKELVHKYLNKIKPLYVRVSRRHADKLEQQQQQQPRVRASPGRQHKKASPAPAVAPPPTVDMVEAPKDSVDSSTSPVSDATTGAGCDQKPQTAGGTVSTPPDASTGDKQLQLQLQTLVTAPSSKPPSSSVPPTQKDKVMVSASASAATQHLQAGLRVVCKHLGKSRSASSAAVAAAPSPPPSTTATTTRRRDDSLLQQQDGIQSAIAHCKRSFNATRADTNLTCSPPPTAESADIPCAPPPPATAGPLPRSRSDPCDEQRCGGAAELVA